MPILKLNLKNCYGIRELKYSFDLSRQEGRGGTFSIYAPNGVMKSSLAKTFDDYSNRQPSEDLIFTSRETVREIKWDHSELDPKTVFVIHPQEKSDRSEAVSTLIMNPSLQQEYSNSMKGLLTKRNTLIRKLKKLSGLTSQKETPYIVLAEDLGAKEENLPDKIKALREDDYAIAHLQGVEYAEIFNQKTLKNLENKDFQAKLEKYLQHYNRLVEESPILSRTFNHQGAKAVSKGLQDAGFYTAGHSVILKDGDSYKPVDNPEELEKIFQEERENILTDESLKKDFDEVDKALGNAETRKLRTLLEDNEELLVDLKDL